MRWSTIFLASLLLSVAACSSTPGDAASRSGHPEAAAKLYRQGADQGDAEAALKLGLLVSKAPQKDYGEAGEWYVKACDMGSLAGCHNAGYAYEYGKSGLGQSYKEAERLYRKAAERGYMQSQYNIGSLYANQYLSDDVEGLKWLFLAQTAARACPSQELCQWVLNDPPQHIQHLKQRMSAQQVQMAEDQASQWVRVK